MRPPQNVLNPDAGPPPGDAGRREQADKIAALLGEFSPRPLGELTCLDIGCYAGQITARLAPLFAATCGLDYDGQALRHARPDPGRRLDYVRADAMRLPFRDGSFSLVLCTHVHEHVPDDRQLFAEIGRVLEPGGIVFFGGPNWLFPVEPHYFVPFLHWLPQRLADRRLQRLGGPPHYYERLRTIWSLRRLFRDYEIVDLTPLVAARRLQALDSWWGRLARRLPHAILARLTPVMPSFNLLLRKRVL
jgi:SAM-dependent methyltransferase